MKRNNYLMVCLLLFISVMSPAQQRVIKEKSLVTDKDMTITVSGEYRDALRTPTRKRYLLLYQRSSKGLLQGNPCAEAVRSRFGFKYTIVPRSHRMKKSRYFFHNFWTNFKLFFKNGPFWKSRMRKKVEDCRIKTHDYVD